MDVVKYTLNVYFKREMFTTSGDQQEYLEESNELFTIFVTQ